MTDHEAALAFEQFSALLDREHLNWLRTQVEAHLRLGKPEQREVAVLEEDVDRRDLFGLPARRRHPGPKASFLGTIEYTPKERLQILAMAIAHAVPHVLEMANAIPELLHPRQGEPAARVIVVRESETGEVEEKTLQTAASAEKLARLRELLGRLASEAAK